MMMNWLKTKPTLALGLLTLVATACSPAVAPAVTEAVQGQSVDTGSEPSATPTHALAGEDCGDPFADGRPNFSLSYWDETNFCLHSVDYDEIFSGGPPPDGIPAIDAPVFESLEAGDEWLEEDWPVMLFELNGETRAYPLAILIYHEIVNDEVGGEPVTLTFCPLCNATIAFNRTLEDGTVLDFGTTGNLRNSDLVMYDRQTQSWWQQFTGEAIVGDLLGTQLEFLPSQIIAWSEFKENHPDGQVLSRATGHNRPYGQNPYAGYDNINSSPWFDLPGDDGRLPPMERVVAVSVDDVDVAFPFSSLEEVRVINDEVNSQPVVVFWQPGTSTAFGNSGVDVGSSGVFNPELDGQLLTFEFDGEGFVDQETGSRWNILGQAVDGPLAGEQLEKVVAGDHFWFAWATFRPDTVVWRGV